MSLESFGNIPEVEKEEAEETSTDEVETLPETESGELPKSYWKKHIGMLLLSFILTHVPEKAEAEPHTETGAVEVVEGQDLVKERREAFEKLKDLVISENIEQKIAELKKYFGPAIDEFLQIHRVERDLDILKNLDQNPAKNLDGVWVNPSGAHFSTIGSIVHEAYRERWERKTVEEKDIQFINIDGIEGVTEEKIKEFLDKVYPKGSASRSIASIEFVRENEIIGQTQILGRAVTRSVSSMSAGAVGEERTPIKINTPVEGINADSFFDILRHEVGHTVSWASSLELSNAERIQMILDVYGRINSDDRYISAYVEGIDVGKIENYNVPTSNYGDAEKKQITDYIKCGEYWAEIHREYFKDKQKFEKEHPVDYELVKKWTGDK